MASTKGKAILPDGEELEVQVLFEKKTEPAFSKAQLLKAKRYDAKQDALHVVLKDDQTYTHEQTETLLKEFYKGGKK